MPLEGQWERQHTPLRRLGARERRLLIAVTALVVAVAVAAAVHVATRGDTRPALAPGCVRVTIASTTGGADARACGRGATLLCRQAANAATPEARALRVQCRERRIPAP